MNVKAADIAMVNEIHHFSAINDRAKGLSKTLLLLIINNDRYFWPIAYHLPCIFSLPESIMNMTGSPQVELLPVEWLDTASTSFLQCLIQMKSIKIACYLIMLVRLLRKATESKTFVTWWHTSSCIQISNILKTR